MKRILFHTLLTAGFFLLVSGNAFAQRRDGGVGGALRGPANAVGPAVRNEAPAIRNEAPAVRNEAPAIRNEAPAIRNDIGNRPATHPFYGNDRGNENDWRYGYHDNRWWYWTPGNAWAYWNDGRWQDYSDAAVPYTTNYRGPTAPVGWYWNDSQKRYYWFDGTNLTAAQQ